MNTTSVFPASGPTAPLHVALLVGSTREGRFADTVTRWVATQVAAHPGFTYEVIDPAQLDLPRRHEDHENEAVRALRARIGRADAFVVVTPEYNHSFTGELKFVIDLVSAEWQAKPVAFVSYGGVSGGLRAVEQLRLVFAELHAVTVRDGVSFASAWELFDEQGNLREPKRPTRSMAALLRRLHWWGRALRQARNEQPYDQAA